MDYKFNIVAVGKDGRIDACVIWSAIGDTGIPVVAATATSGLEQLCFISCNVGNDQSAS